MPEANQTATQPAPPDVLTEKEVAAELRVSVEKVRRMRYSVPPRGPRFFRVDRSIRYRRRDVAEFVDLSLVATLKQPIDDTPTPSTKRRGRRAA